MINFTTFSYGKTISNVSSSLDTLVVSTSKSVSIFLQLLATKFSIKFLKYNCTVYSYIIIYKLILLEFLLIRFESVHFSYKIFAFNSAKHDNFPGC